jgi:hypothetical protein
LDSIAAQLSSLMRQFKIERSDHRFDMSLPARLTAIDVNGLPLDQEVMTINVSRKGALLTGIHGKLRLGSQLSLARLQKLEKFLIAWVGTENTPGAGQIGVSAVDPATSFWNDVLETRSPDEQASADDKYLEELPAKPKARAHGA